MPSLTTLSPKGELVECPHSVLPQKQREDLNDSQGSDQLVSQGALGFAFPETALPMVCGDYLTSRTEPILQGICYSIMAKGFNSTKRAFWF